MTTMYNNTVSINDYCVGKGDLNPHNMVLLATLSSGINGTVTLYCDT
jgi:O-antigen ligase